jgi:acetyl esterase/lipase
MTTCSRGVSYDTRLPHRLLDVYQPRAVPGSPARPGVVVVHGGGFFKGGRADGIAVQTAEELALAGFVAFSVDYRLAQDANDTKPAFPGNIHDCKTAVRWIRAHAADYNVDPARIGAIGGSAGGWLALCLGLTAGDEYFDPPGEGSAAVQAVVSMYAPTDGEWAAHHYGYADTEDMPWARKHSPVNWVTPGAAATLILHGTADTIVLPENARLLDQAFRRAGARHELVWVEGAGHTFPIHDGHHDLRPQVLAFFRSALGYPPAPQDGG